MNFTKQHLFILYFFSISTHSCFATLEGAGKDAADVLARATTTVSDSVIVASSNIKDGMECVGIATLNKAESIGIGVFSKIGVAAKSTSASVKNFISTHPAIGTAGAATVVAAATGAAIAIAAAPFAVIGYVGYRWYHGHQDRKITREKIKLDLHLKEEKAKLEREVIENEIRIKEEDARIKREILQQNTNLRNRIIITTSYGIGAIVAGCTLAEILKNVGHRKE